MNEDMANIARAVANLKEAMSKMAETDTEKSLNDLIAKLESVSIAEEEKNRIELGTIPRGGLFDTELGRFLVLDHDRTYGFTKVIQYDFYKEDVGFDDNSCDYLKSDLRELFDG